MRRYETIVILKPTLGEEDNQAVIDRATGIIEEFKGSVIKIDKWGLKKLAYLIRKESQGYYVYILYAGMPAGVDEMERVFRIDDRVMKFLTVKLQDVYTPLPEDEEENKPVETSSEEEETKAVAPEAEESVTEEENKPVETSSEEEETKVVAPEAEESVTEEEDKPVKTPSEEKDTEEALDTGEAVAEEAAAETDK